MSSEPRDLSAALYAFQFVVRYFRGAGFMHQGYLSLPHHAVPMDLCNKAPLAQNHRCEVAVSLQAANRDRPHSARSRF